MFCGNIASGVHTKDGVLAASAQCAGNGLGGSTICREFKKESQSAF